jgi:hypothetical protein
MGTRSRLSPGLFGFVLILFMFPFATFSCMGQEVGSLSGLKLATGTSIEEPSMFGESENRKVPSNALAMLALTATVAGLGLALGGRRGLAMAAGAIGAVALLGMQAGITDAVRTQTEGVIGVRFTAAYWLAVLSLFAAAVVSVLHTGTDRQSEGGDGTHRAVPR